MEYGASEKSIREHSQFSQNAAKVFPTSSFVEVTHHINASTAIPTHVVTVTAVPATALIFITGAADVVPPAQFSEVV